MLRAIVSKKILFTIVHDHQTPPGILSIKICDSLDTSTAATLTRRQSRLVTRSLRSRAPKTSTRPRSTTEINTKIRSAPGGAFALNRLQMPRAFRARAFRFYDVFFILPCSFSASCPCLVFRLNSLSAFLRSFPCSPVLCTLPRPNSRNRRTIAISDLPYLPCIRYPRPLYPL